MRNLHLKRSEPQYRQLTPQKLSLVHLWAQGLRQVWVTVWHFLLLQLHWKPISSLTVMRKWLRRRPFAECWNRSEVAAVFFPLGYALCVLPGERTKDVFLFLRRVSFLNFPILAPMGHSTIWQAIDNSISSLSHCLSHSCLVSLVICVCLLYNHVLCWYFLTSCSVFSSSQWWDVCCVAQLTPAFLPKMSPSYIAGRPELKFVWYITWVWLAWCLRAC